MNLSDVEIFKNNMNTLKNLSKDETNNEYMTESKLMAVNFDKVKTEYIKSFNAEGIDSVDALLQNKNEILFIEFKNGKIDNKEKRDLKYKIRDSLLIFSDIEKCYLDNIRKEVCFILVYNDVKNPKSYSKNSTQNSAINYCEKIKEKIASCADEKIVRFSLNMFKSIYFKNIYTFTAEEFAEYITKNCQDARF